LRRRTTLFLSAAIGWLVAGLLYQTLPCKDDAALLSSACLPESLEILVVFLLLASVPWFTLRSATRQLHLARTGVKSRLSAFGRFVLTALVTVGAVFIAGSAVVLLSQAFALGLFSGEGGLRVIVVALLASAWAIVGIAAMAVLLGMPRKPPQEPVADGD
jgi:hypothetical protein